MNPKGNLYRSIVPNPWKRMSKKDNRITFFSCSQRGSRTWSMNWRLRRRKSWCCGQQWYYSPLLTLPIVLWFQLGRNLYKVLQDKADKPINMSLSLNIHAKACLWKAPNLLNTRHTRLTISRSRAIWNVDRQFGAQSILQFIVQIKITVNIGVTRDAAEINI